MRAAPEDLEAALGQPFRDREILRRALTHKSHFHEQSTASDPPPGDNEQLEFLGDSILGFLVSESLVSRFPGFPEGRLSKLKAQLVSAAHLHEVAHRLELGKYLLLGRGEEMSGGRDKKALLANAVEALLAALYLDQGIDSARRFVLQYVVGDFPEFPDGVDYPLNDFKSALQEAAQFLRLPQPRYTTTRERGPEHAKTFTVEVRVGEDWVAQADGPSKKSAGQKAAKEVLERLMGPGGEKASGPGAFPTSRS